MLKKGRHIAALAQFELVSAMETSLVKELISDDEGAAAARFNISRDTVDTTLAISVPPGYRRTAPIKRPKLDGDKTVHRKRRHSAKRVLSRASTCMCRAILRISRLGAQRCLRAHLPKQ